MLFFSFLFALLWLPAAVFAAFGYTDDGSNYVIDSGAALVIKVSKTTGDITSSKQDFVTFCIPSPRHPLELDTLLQQLS